LRVFFGGSLEQALAAHFSDPKMRLDEAELRRLRAPVEELGGQELAAARETRKGKKS
jgi:hypothetical protein